MSVLVWLQKRHIVLRHCTLMMCMCHYLLNIYYLTIRGDKFHVAFCQIRDLHNIMPQNVLILALTVTATSEVHKPVRNVICSLRTLSVCLDFPKSLNYCCTITESALLYQTNRTKLSKSLTHPSGYPDHHKFR